MNWEGQFQAGAGIAPGVLAMYAASLVAVSILLFLAWVGITQFQAWRSGRQDAFPAFWTLTMATVLAMLIGFFVRP